MSQFSKTTREAVLRFRRGRCKNPPETSTQELKERAERQREDRQHRRKVRARASGALPTRTTRV